MTFEEAVTYVTKKAHTEEFPVVPSDDVEEIVRMNMRAKVWQPETAYKFGDKVQPTIPNGHFYRCRVNSASGVSEPIWDVREHSWTYDGENQIWQEVETDFDTNLYNTRTAIHECWLYKAGVAANQFDISIDQQKWTRSQIHDHCLKMAQSFAPIE